MGLIPISGFAPESIGEFDSFINSLDPMEKKSATRKFRKIFRKIAKEKIRSSHNPDYVEKTLMKNCGYKSLNPTKSQKKSRRRLVHSYILNQYNQRRKNDS